MSDDRKFFVFIGGRDYHPDSRHFSPVLGQPYIVVTLQATSKGWYAEGEVRSDVPNTEIRPHVISSSTTHLEDDLRGFLGNKARAEDIGLMTRAVYSVLVNLVIDSAKKTQDPEVTAAAH